MSMDTFKERSGRVILKTRPGQRFQRYCSYSEYSTKGIDEETGKKGKLCNYLVTDVYPHFVYVYNETLHREETMSVGDLVMAGMEPSDPFGEMRGNTRKVSGPSLSSKLAYGK